MVNFLILTLAVSQPISVPQTITVRPGRAATIEATTQGKLVRWIPGSDEFDLVPLNDSGTRVLFVSPTPGKYLAWAYTAIDGVPTPPVKCTITVSDGPAPPPNPLPPGPSPNPPVPPPVPPPDDPLTQEFQSLYNRETSSAKAQHLRLLAELYLQAQSLAADPGVATAADLAQRIRTASGYLVPAAAMVPIRERIAVLLAESLPNDPNAQLDQATRQKAVVLFTRVHNALKGVK